MSCSWPGAALLVLVLLTGFLSPVWLASQDERAIRAAYVFNLTKYVEWPPESQQLVIGVIGNRGTGEFLQKLLHGRMSGSRPLQVKLSSSIADLRDCNIIYLAEGLPKKTLAAIETMHFEGVLTIGETDTFPDEGGMIALVRLGDQVQMQLNPEAVERGGVKLDSQLLKLAVIVSPGTIVAQTPPFRTATEHPNPVYPPMAAKLFLHGIVRLEIRIGPNGKVRHVECVGGNPVLADAATKAVTNWRYEPAASESTQTLQFKF
jgi:TonB family protein